MLRRVLMIVLISIVPVVTNTGTAHAETAYPAYCWDPNHWDAAKTGYASYDTPSRWSYESCWLGGSYRTFVTAGGDDSIRLPQWEIYWATYGACTLGQYINGQWNSYTTAYVKCYQAKRGLSQDAIIGTATWGKLASDMVLSGCGYHFCQYGSGLSGTVVEICPYETECGLLTTDAWCYDIQTEIIMTPFYYNGSFDTGVSPRYCSNYGG